MVLKLDPRFSIVWRDPFSMQFGTDPPRVVLREVSAAEERLIAALGLGISRTGLRMTAISCDIGEREVESLLRRLGPVLVHPRAQRPPHTVAIAGVGPTVERIADTLVSAGVRAEVGASVPHSPCDFGIAVGHHVLDPESYGFWLRRDVPHLSVVFGDDAVSIGPLVEPGVTACLYCLEHHRRDADGSWAAIAAQLWGRHAASETLLSSIETTARVVRLALARLAGERARTATTVRIAADSGQTTVREWLPHPECGCIDLSESQPGSDSALDSARPTTGATVGVRA